MENIRIRFSLTILFVAIVSFLPELKGQDAIPATGGTISGSGGSVSYTVGQVAYTTNTGTGGSVTQGVQQPYSISVVSEVPEARGISLECSVYPNPASSYVMLKIENLELNTLDCQLYNAEGKLLQNIKIEDKLTVIPLDDLPRATYFLKLTKEGSDIKVFQVVKN